MNDRERRYAEGLSALIQKETVSVRDSGYLPKFREFHQLLADRFPLVFRLCETEDFDGSLLLRWRGTDGDAEPIMLMNHHDVVQAFGDWKYPPFSGTIAEGKLWGRGTLDTKGGLWAMLQAAEELAADGFVPRRDVYFQSSADEEVAGLGATAIAKALKERGIRLAMVLDEGGMVLRDPFGCADAVFALIGVGEKGVCDLRFSAYAAGGHASVPPKNTPLVRLGRFMAEAEKLNDRLFPSELCPTVREMLRRMSPYMEKGLFRTACADPDRFVPVLKKMLPSVSPAAGAMLKTTLAFTMAQGSEGMNVLPHEAWVTGNMRFSHHQGGEKSRAVIEKLAKKHGVTMEVTDPGMSSAIADYNGEAFRRVESAVRELFPDAVPVPYLMTGATDSHFFDGVCDNVLRFSPFAATREQHATIHTTDENVDISALPTAVDFYKYILRES